MKKYAIFSDIHSNVYALKSCIKDALDCGATDFINLGDIFYGPIAPRKTYELLQKYDFITICGNQDRQILQATKKEIEQNKTLNFVIKDLGCEGMDWLKTLPFDKQITQNIYACHGSPKSDTEYLLEKIKNETLVVKSNDETLLSLKNITPKIILCGHSHLPKVVELSNGQTVINVGSVGLQAYKDDEPKIHKVENFCPKASYVLLTLENTSLNISFKKIDYDIKSAVNCAKEQKRDDWVGFLKTGRVE